MLKLIPKAQAGTQLQTADNVIYKAQPLKAITIRGEITARGKKIQKYLPYLNDFQRAQLQKYYTNSDGTYTDRGIQYIEDMATANFTGQSQFMKDLNRVSHPVHEGLSGYRYFMNNHPQLEVIYDVTSAGLSTIPLTAPIGYIMAGIDAASGVDDMVNNGVHFDNVVDVAGILPAAKYTKTIKGVQATRKGLRYRRGIPDIKVNPIGTPVFGGELISDIQDAREIKNK